MNSMVIDLLFFSSTAVGELNSFGSRLNHKTEISALGDHCSMAARIIGAVVEHVIEVPAPLGL